jgi:UDP-N-acetyl-D-glucosamine dehydrogenase
MNIESRPQSGVAVVGLGYVGLPLCLAFAEAGVRTIGIDTDSSKATALNDGQSYIKHVSADRIKAAIRGARLVATTDFGDAAYADAVLICVPTPLTVNRVPDLSYVEATARSLAPHVQRGQLVVLESTTYPGTTDEVLRPILEAGSGLVAGVDFHLAFSPEREDPGNPKSLRDIPKVVGGLTVTCRERATALYSQIVGSVVPVSSPSVAEATKLLENIFRAVNIALVNELKVIYDRMGIDVWEVIHAAATKPFGYMPFYPGPGLGGHCIPIDPFYLSWKALEFGMSTRLIELAGEINTAMPHYVVERISEALNESGRAVNGSRVLLLGLAYKPNVDDDRESPTYEIMRLLEERKAKVFYNDPHVPVIRPGRTHHAVAGRESQPITSEYDVLVLCTNHREYDGVDFADLGVPVVDCRNAVRKRPAHYYRA